MKNERLFECIGEIDEKFIAEAKPMKTEKKEQKNNKNHKLINNMSCLIIHYIIILYNTLILPFVNRRRKLFSFVLHF